MVSAKHARSGLARNNIIVPQDDDVKFSYDVLEGEVLISELTKHCNDLAILAATFGPKLATLLTWRWIRLIMFRDPKKLSLACLRNLDFFTMEYRDAFARTQNHAVKGTNKSQPLLYWLYPVLLEWFVSTTSSHPEFKFKFTSAVPQDGQSRRSMAPIDLRLRSNSQAQKFIELAIHRGGEYDKREIFTAYIKETNVSKKTKWGKTTAEAAATINPGVPVIQSVPAVLDALFPREGNQWRLAVGGLDDNDEEKFLTALVDGGKASDDVYFMSAEQQQRFLDLFSRFPVEAQKALRDRVGSLRGPFSPEALRPDPRD